MQIHKSPRQMNLIFPARFPDERGAVYLLDGRRVIFAQVKINLAAQ